MIWELVNSFGRLLLTAIVVYKVTQFRATMNVIERFGLSLMGGGSFLTSALIWDPQGPLQGWSVSILTYGAVLFLWGRTWRDMRHHRANEAMARQGEIWRQQRGAGK